MNAPFEATPVPDFITILRAHRGRILAKRVATDGTITPYDQAKFFAMATVGVTDLGHLRRHLDYLLHRSDLGAIRGKVVGGDRIDHARRLLHPDPLAGDPPTLTEAPHYWIALDVDGVARPDDVSASDLRACAEIAVGLLPKEFHRARCIIAATASHGLKSGCRLRLWFWADRKLSGPELARWLRRAPIDDSLFCPAQIHYTAAPVFAPGTADHLQYRIAERPGNERVVAPSAAELAPPPVPDFSPSKQFTSPNVRLTKIMIGALTKVETAPHGQLHERLRAAAYLLGGVLDVAGISEDEATQKLMEACRRAAGSHANPTKDLGTIKSGITHGRTKPLSLMAGGSRNG